MRPIVTYAPDGPALELTWPTTALRDAAIAELFPQRRTTDTPGLFVAGEYELLVRLEVATVWARCACSYGASGSHTLACLTYAGRKMDALERRIAALPA